MKKTILILATLIACHITTTAQQEQSLISNLNAGIEKNIMVFPGTGQANSVSSSVNSNTDNEYESYKPRSRNLRITGLSLLGGGLIMGVSALLISSNNNSYSDSRDKTITTLFILSAATGIASIPLMVLAHVNNTKARAAMSTQKTFIPGKGNSYLTGITLSLPVGK